MGIRGHLPLALSALLLAAGCVDFADPVVPFAGAPPLAQVSVSIFEQGIIVVNASVQPGRDSSGVTRVPADSTVVVGGIALEPNTIQARNTMAYSKSLPFSAEQRQGPIVIRMPPIHGIIAPPPEVEWFTVARVGPDTVSVPLGQDLVLLVDTELGVAQPAPQVRQWFLDLNGPTGVFRLSGNDFPPDTLRIPPQWIPVDAPGQVTANLTFYQSAVLRPPPGDYTGSISLDARIQWSIRVR